MAITNCPMCLFPIPPAGDEPAKLCPGCGADLASWRLKHAKTPLLVACPMCEGMVPIEGNEPTLSCPSCGADLSRKMPRTPKVSEVPKAKVRFNPGLGIVGALLGAAVGAGIVFGLHKKWPAFHLPLLVIGIGLLTGIGARLLNRGPRMTLGLISGVAAVLAVAGTLHFLYGTLTGMDIITVVVGAILAYWIAS